MLDAEREVIAQAQTGNPDAFGKLYDHYLPNIYRYVFAKINHREETEDITHEVFLSAWKNIQRYAYSGFPFSSWLYRIARNRVIDHYRLQRQDTSIELVDPDALRLTSTTEQLLDTALAWNHVRTALQRLNDQEQEVLILRFVNDLSPKEIATVLDKSEGAIRVIQHRAIATLKRLIHDSPPTP